MRGKKKNMLTLAFLSTLNKVLETDGKALPRPKNVAPTVKNQSVIETLLAKISCGRLNFLG